MQEWVHVDPYQSSSEESSFISDVNDMSLESEGFLSNIEEVKNW